MTGSKSPQPSYGPPRAAGSQSHASPSVAHGCPPAAPSAAAATALYLLCTAGIYACYLVFGLVQEQLKEQRFGALGEQFRFTGFLLAAQCLANAAVAAAMCTHARLPLLPPPAAGVGLREFACISAAFGGAMYCSNVAVLHVAYPTMVLVKSLKPVPVLLLGLAAAGSRAAFPAGRVLSVALIAAGAAWFMHGEAAAGAAAGESSCVGYALLALSLALDGAVGSRQDRCMGLYRRSRDPDARAMAQWHLMMWPSAFTAAFLACALAATGNLAQPLLFCARHPDALRLVALYSAVGAVGQVFIFLTISHFGTLTCSIVTTLRKFTSIVCSVIVYGHPMSAAQWVALAAVFFGVVIDMRLAKSVPASSAGAPKKSE
eukprot:m51a1_g3207 putative solute carrier family 35 member b1 (374) ;mRNA; r:21667-23262